MPNKYIISEAQERQLIERKKRAKKIAEEIQSKINRINGSLNESQIKESAIETLLERYSRKGLLTKAVKKLLNI